MWGEDLERAARVLGWLSVAGILLLLVAAFALGVLAARA